MIVVLIIFGFTSIGLSLFFNTAHSEREIRRLIERSYNNQRPGRGRLSGASYTPVGPGFVADTDLARAQILLLGLANSQALQGIVHLAAGEWQKFAELATNVSLPRNSATLNNLGASYLALSEKDPVFLLKAVD